MPTFQKSSQPFKRSNDPITGNTADDEGLWAVDNTSEVCLSILGAGVLTVEFLAIEVGTDTLVPVYMEDLGAAGGVATQVLSLVNPGATVKRYRLKVPCCFKTFKARVSGYVSGQVTGVIYFLGR